MSVNLVCLKNFGRYIKTKISKQTALLRIQVIMGKQDKKSKFSGGYKCAVILWNGKTPLTE